MIHRGLGLYGQEVMAKIAYDSQIAVTDKNEIDWLTEDHDAAIEKLLINYGKRSLPAKMTAVVLAKRYNVPIPEILTAAKKGKARKGIFKLKRRR